MCKYNSRVKPRNRLIVKLKAIKSRKDIFYSFFSYLHYGFSLLSYHYNIYSLHYQVVLKIFAYIIALLDCLQAIESLSLFLSRLLLLWLKYYSSYILFILQLLAVIIVIIIIFLIIIILIGNCLNNYSYYTI